MSFATMKLPTTILDTHSILIIKLKLLKNYATHSHTARKEFNKIYPSVCIMAYIT